MVGKGVKERVCRQGSKAAVGSQGRLFTHQKAGRYSMSPASSVSSIGWAVW